MVSGFFVYFALSVSTRVGRVLIIALGYVSARKDDAAGKGHEDYQEIEGVKHPMDERILIKEVLEELGK